MFTRALKDYVVWLLLIIALAVFSLLFLFPLTQVTREKSISQSLRPKNEVTRRAPLGFPVRLKIPKINVDAAIVYVGLTPDGSMEVPKNAVDVGWFGLGPHPGEKGNAVIDGHFSGENGEAGVFTNLYQLQDGDKLYIEDGYGTSLTFVVRESRIYDPGYAEEVFSSDEGTHLNLVTCDGAWDGDKKSYNKRLVVFTDATN